MRLMRDRDWACSAGGGSSPVASLSSSSLKGPETWTTEWNDLSQRGGLSFSFVVRAVSEMKHSVSFFLTISPNSILSISFEIQHSSWPELVVSILHKITSPKRSQGKFYSLQSFAKFLLELTPFPLSSLLLPLTFVLKLWEDSMKLYLLRERANKKRW